MYASENLPFSRLGFQFVWPQLELRISYLFKMNNEFLSFLCFMLIWKNGSSWFFYYSVFCHTEKNLSVHNYLSFTGSSEQLFVVCLLCKEIAHWESNVFDLETTVANTLLYLHVSPIILGKEGAKLSGCFATLCDVAARFKYSLLNKWDFMQFYHSIN